MGAWSAVVIGAGPAVARVAATRRFGRQILVAEAGRIAGRLIWITGRGVVLVRIAGRGVLIRIARRGRPVRVRCRAWLVRVLGSAWLAWVTGWVRQVLV